MLPRIARLRRAVTLLCLLPAPLLAQDVPSAPWQVMLGFRPFLTNAEPSLRLPYIDIAFTPADGGNATVVVKRDGKVETSILCTPTQRVGNMQRYQPRRPFAALEAVEGERVVELQLGGRVVGSITVNFRKLANTDPFGTTAGWVATGPWADHGYFTRPVEATEQQRVSFTFWASTLELNGAPKAMVDLVVLRGRTVIAKTEQREVSSADWLPKREPLLTPAGQALFAEDLGADGPISIELRTGGKVLRRWETRLQNGWVVPHALSATPPTDPLHFLSPRTISEGGASLNPLTFAWVTR
jgi:hypothetical protein